MENLILVNHNKNWGLKLDDRSLMIDRWIESTANKILKDKGFNSDVELSIAFVGRKKARDLNINYRQKDYYPQVLGFPMSTKKDVDGKIRLGDIVICTQKLKYEEVFSKKKRSQILKEWLIHGVENLLK